MSFTPPSGNNVELNFSGEYTAPEGDAVFLPFGNVLDNYIRTANVIFDPTFAKTTLTEADLIQTHNFILDTSFGSSLIDPLIHINADNAVFELSQPLFELQILPDIVNHTFTIELNDDIFEIGGNAETDLPSGISPGTSMFYGYKVSPDLFFDTVWGNDTSIDINHVFNFTKFIVLDFHIVIPWRIFYEEDISDTIYYDSLSVVNIDVESSWHEFFTVDQFRTTVYGGINSFDWFISEGYGDSVPCDHYVEKDWSTFHLADVIQNTEWFGIGVSDREHEVPWGPRALFAFCHEQYVPPATDTFINFAFPPRNTTYAETLNFNTGLFFHLESTTSLEAVTNAESSAFANYQSVYNTWKILNAKALELKAKADSENIISITACGQATYAGPWNLTYATAYHDAYLASLEIPGAMQNWIDAKYNLDNWKQTEVAATTGGIVLEPSSYSSDPRCETIHDHTGPVDNGGTGGGEVPHPYQPPPFVVKQVYYIMNTVLVQTLPGSVQIEVKGLTMTIDRDSWLWQLNMTVGKREYVDLLSPKNGIFVTVQVNINGWKWIFSIESWQENIGFAKGSYTVSGRSPSLVLGDPICEKKSYTHTTDSTGSFIIGDILTGNGLGFSVAFSDYAITQTGFNPTSSDWNIPADTFTYSNQTEIQAFQMLTDSIGAYIQTNRDFYNYPAGVDGRFLEILPRYNQQPWNWTAGNTDITWTQLDKSIIREMGSAYKKSPDYYGAYIVGEKVKDGAASTGTFCNVYRFDMGPSSTHAPVISGPLYTTDQIAQEKGRMIIGDSGIWVEHSLKVFSLFPSGTAPGLLKVGDMINVTTGATTEWRGLITGTEISAQITGKSVFSVSQTLSVSQYVGDWVG